jgi:transcriptional regulator GlxA family with amidase domain
MFRCCGTGHLIERQFSDGRTSCVAPLNGREDRSPEAIENRAPEAIRALPGDLVRALRWLRGHPHQPVRLEALAAVAGVRPRTLETRFKLYLGTTPLGWVRRTRLALARQQLLRADSSTSVT